MSIFKYTCENNPSGAIQLANKFSSNTVQNARQAQEVMLNVMQKGDNETKEALLLELREIHPDSELYRDDSGVGFWNIKSVPVTNSFPIEPSLAIKPEPSVPQYIPVQMPMPMMNACGCGGHNAMMHASGGNKSTEKFAKIENENSTKKMIFNTVVAIVLLAVVYKLFIKK